MMIQTDTANYLCLFIIQNVTKGKAMTQELKNTSTPTDAAVLWTVHDLMHFCHFSRTRAYRVIKDPAMPTVYIGGRVFILRQKFVEILEQNARNRDHPIFEG